MLNEIEQGFDHRELRAHIDRHWDLAIRPPDRLNSGYLYFEIQYLFNTVFRCDRLSGSCFVIWLGDFVYAKSFYWTAVICM